MNTTTQQIDALLSVRSEDEHLEFKAAENRYDFEELVGYCPRCQDSCRLTRLYQTIDLGRKVMSNESLFTRA